MAKSGDQRAANHEQLQAFCARLPVDHDDLGRLIFDADITIKAESGVVSDRSRVMISHVDGDTGEVVVFKSGTIDIRIYYLDFNATFQTFTCIDNRFLRIEGAGPKTGTYICEIYPRASTPA